MIRTFTPNPVLDLTLTVPTIVFNAMSRASGVREDWGGKGFNVSRALRALDVDSVAMGFLGGATGHKLEAGLRGLGIEVAPITIAGETRTNVVIAEPDGARYVKVNQSGPTVRAKEIDQCLRRVEADVRAGAWWALCGSLPPGVPSDFYAQLITAIRGKGGRVILDASGEPLRAGIAAGPDLVKPNAVEVEALTGAAIASGEQAAGIVDDLRALGAVDVAISLGEQGLMLARGATRVWARPPTIQARNPVGAGDALVAGLLLVLSTEADPVEVARWGVASGTAAAQGEGVSVGTLDDVRAVYEDVTVRDMRDLGQTL
jgi:1-phosphofructokinase family hexose kinase